ncbi:MAG: hypothetical protein R3250_05840 [Melioribacteraceae bacterium]|nr:hypothetical protein [Melioribacteraceae bacterium]
MAIDTKTYKLIVPESELDSAYEEFEFLLQWYSTYGGLYQRMFTDWENDDSIQSTVINITDQDLISTLPNNETRKVLLGVDDISLTDLIAMKSILKARKVNRVYKDGALEPIGIDSGSVRYKQSGKRYSMSFTAVLYSKKLPQ